MSSLDPSLLQVSLWICFWPRQCVYSDHGFNHSWVLMGSQWVLMSSHGFSVGTQTVHFWVLRGFSGRHPPSESEIMDVAIDAEIDIVEIDEISHLARCRYAIEGPSGQGGRAH